jgi:RND family efflux transporter MFP subunit
MPEFTSRWRRALIQAQRSSPLLPRTLSIALALTLTMLADAGCSRSETAQARGRDGAPKEVGTAVVRKESVRRAVDVVGTLAAVDQVTISSEAEGRVHGVLADLGDQVRAGQVLIRLDSEKQQYTYEQQQAALARALAQYGASDPQHLPDVDQTPDVQKAKADLFQAQQSFERANELFKQTLVPQQAFDDARAALQARQASYEAARQSARSLRASIQASEATMKLAGRQLRDAEIRAAFDGYVERRLVNLGELVRPQTPVMAIVRLDPLKVTAEMPEKMAPWITDGRPVELHVDAYKDRTFTGKVTRISPAVNTATRAFPFEALVPNRDAALKPGTFARVHVESGKVDDLLTLPYAALQYRYGVNRVFVIAGNRLALRELEVGERLGDRIEIASGVKEGDRVAVTDVDTLEDGMAVTAKR